MLKPFAVAATFGLAIFGSQASADAADAAFCSTAACCTVAAATTSHGGPAVQAPAATQAPKAAASPDYGYRTYSYQPVTGDPTYSYQPRLNGYRSPSPGQGYRNATFKALGRY